MPGYLSARRYFIGGGGKSTPQCVYIGPGYGRCSWTDIGMQCNAMPACDASNLLDGLDSPNFIVPCMIETSGRVCDGLFDI